MGKKNSTRPLVFNIKLNQQIVPKVAMNFVQQITQIMALHRCLLHRATNCSPLSSSTRTPMSNATSDGIVLSRESSAPHTFGNISFASNLRWLSQMTYVGIYIIRKMRFAKFILNRNFNRDVA